ncbi:MAG: redoxin domain-containing protein [Armatimonadetes bacterium]|nr:redoxin domain-containing protein [Armatimonadota bacterium]
MAQLRRDEAAFHRRNASVALIGMGTPGETDAFCRSRSLPFACLSDPSRQAYEAYGLARVSLPQILGSGRAYIRMASAFMQGHGFSRPVGDARQMPGVFIVDRAGRVRYAHRHKDVSDNPPNEALLAVLDEV